MGDANFLRWRQRAPVPCLRRSRARRTDKCDGLFWNFVGQAPDGLNFFSKAARGWGDSTTKCQWFPPLTPNLMLSPRAAGIGLIGCGGSPPALQISAFSGNGSNDPGWQSTDGGRVVKGVDNTVVNNVVRPSEQCSTSSLKKPCVADPMSLGVSPAKDVVSIIKSSTVPAPLQLLRSDLQDIQ
jgi:hypothetical protein